MGLLPMGADILPPSDDRVFKLLLTSPDAKPGLINLISSIIGRTVVDVVLHPNELAPGYTEEKAERFDVNCKIDDGSQINLEMQASRIVEDLDGQNRNLKGKSIFSRSHDLLSDGSPLVSAVKRSAEVRPAGPVLSDHVLRVHGFSASSGLCEFVFPAARCDRRAAVRRDQLDIR